MSLTKNLGNKTPKKTNIFGIYIRKPFQKSIFLLEPYDIEK
jgi:hypothetical protein